MAKGRNTRNRNQNPDEITPTEGGSGNLSGRIRYVGPPQIGKILLPDNTMIRVESPESSIRTAIAKYPDLLSMYFSEEE